jgi:hypothetical protein
MAATPRQPTAKLIPAAEHSKLAVIAAATQPLSKRTSNSWIFVKTAANNEDFAIKRKVFVLL